MGIPVAAVLYVTLPSSPTFIRQANYLLPFLHYCSSTPDVEPMK